MSSALNLSEDRQADDSFGLPRSFDGLIRKVSEQRDSQCQDHAERGAEDDTLFLARLSRTEVAARMERSEDSVRNLLSRALAALAETLGGRPPQPSR